MRVYHASDHVHYEFLALSRLPIGLECSELFIIPQNGHRLAQLKAKDTKSSHPGRWTLRTLKTTALYTEVRTFQPAAQHQQKTEILSPGSIVPPAPMRPRVRYEIRERAHRAWTSTPPRRHHTHMHFLLQRVLTAAGTSYYYVQHDTRSKLMQGCSADTDKPSRLLRHAVCCFHMILCTV